MSAMTLQANGLRVPAFHVGDRLVKAREEAAIGQARMGELLGCSPRTIQRYEKTGKVPRSVILGYHVATRTDLSWLEHGVASPEKLPDLDSNQEPIVIGRRRVPRTADIAA